MSALRDGQVAPWIKDKAATAKAMLKRNLNGIGRTAISFDDDVPMAVIVEKSARASLRAIERAEANEEGEDRSRSEYGTIDAHVARMDTWYGKPAIYVKDRLSGKIIPCVMSDELAAREGPSHSWTDAWAGKRVRVKGRIFYDKRGSINRVSAVDLSDVEPKPVDIKSLREINILSGKSPTEHLDKFWGYTDD